ncbi:MAG: zf-HC2 domain-containing protein [Anaerolineales bacterium]|nr:zf-HC2 domain-containing protein [Anaerolineales bacterium]MCX7609185.1 zf-HC2 domain-containing protein [Anaerolineales bacterium]MDW8227780.1 zf-HC2 domain-containing protein [Anaerolineales bacterium]
MSGQVRCQDLLASLSDYVDGVLDEALCREIEAHMAACPNCRVVVDTLRKTIYLYHQMSKEPATLPSVVQERLYRMLHLDDYRKL